MSEKDTELLENSKNKKEKNKKEKNTKEKNKKEKPVVKQNPLVKFFKTEYRFESYLLGLVSAIAIGVGAIIITKTVNFAPSLASFQVPIGWTFVVLGIIGLLVFIIPVFKPARKELKQLTLPTKKLFLGNVVRVFVFITILTLLLLLYDITISTIIGKLV